MIVTFDCDLVITYSWSNNNHGICGHTYEVIDYYLLLSKFMSCKILLAEDIDESIFTQAITSKYSLSDAQVQNIINNTMFKNRPVLLKGNKILFVDGGMHMIEKYTLLFKDIYIFGCGDKNIINFTDKYHILLDHRVYGNYGRNYVKKIDFKNLKKINSSDNRNMVYATSNCRKVNIEILNRIDNPLVISNIDYNGFECIKPPVEKIFEKFQRYYYTPIARKWDCSPRFIAECHYYNKEVDYIDIDYLDEDLGLYWRKYDIENNFESLFLKDDDEIIGIINEKF